MGKDKDKNVIVSSYSSELATDHGRETRNRIKTKEYQNLFPGTELAVDSKAKGRWNTNGKGGYVAVGVGGSITGRGADYFIVDDPFKDRKEADSETIREDRWKWLKQVARTRLTPKGCMVILQTRWHEDDIIGRVASDEDWTSYWNWKKGDKAKWVRLTLPAIAEDDEPHRKKGEALWPEQYPLEEIKEIKQEIGPYGFSALYQQNPVDDESREFKKNWLNYIEWEKVDMKRTRNFVTIDPGGKKVEHDFSGIVRNYVDSQNNWHIKAMRVHIDSAELIDYIFKLHDEGFEVIGIEDTVYTQAIKPFLNEECRKRNKFPKIEPLKHRGSSKESRIRGLIPRYSSGSVYHIKGECSDLEEEMRTFPKGTYDDTLDALAYQNEIAEPPMEERLRRERDVNAMKRRERAKADFGL